MKFILGTASSSLQFEEDLKLIKSSLLYADEIELIGMAEYAVFKYLPKCLSSVKDVESLVDSFVPFLKSINSEDANSIIEQLEGIKAGIMPFKTYLTRKKHRTRQELLAQMKYKQTLDQFNKTLSEGLSQYTESPNANEINKLIDRGIISVFDYGYEEFNVDALAGGYVGNLLGTIQNHAAYPLFDEASNSVISTFSKNKLLDLGHVDNEIIVHAGLASNILMTLPTLEKATIDEILDFKKDMQGPLANFRKAIYIFAENIESHPWDQDFQYDCLKIYSTEVAPKVEELNVLSSETSVLKNMGRKVLADEEIRKKAAWAAGGLVTTITTANNMVGAMDALQNLILSASAIVIAPNAVSALLKTLNLRSVAKQEVKKQENEMKKNTMYYYYLASRLKS